MRSLAIVGSLLFMVGCSQTLGPDASFSDQEEDGIIAFSTVTLQVDERNAVTKFLYSDEPQIVMKWEIIDPISRKKPGGFGTTFKVGHAISETGSLPKYHIVKVKPGLWALAALGSHRPGYRVRGFSTSFQGRDTPMVQVRSGKITFAGDFTVSPPTENSGRTFRLTYRGFDVSGLRRELSLKFPNIRAELVTPRTRSEYYGRLN